MASTLIGTSFAGAESTHSFYDRMIDWAIRTGKSVQMSQMQHALTQLDDEHLQRLGISRTEIPAYARKIIYQNG